MIISEVMKMVFSEKLQILRKNKGYTQETLAQQLGVVRQTVSKWEKGLSVPECRAAAEVG